MQAVEAVGTAVQAVEAADTAVGVVPGEGYILSLY